MDEEVLAYRVLAIQQQLAGEDGQIVRQLWHDRQFLLVRMKIIAEGLEGSNAPEEVQRWAREGYQEVI